MSSAYPTTTSSSRPARRTATSVKTRGHPLRQAGPRLLPAFPQSLSEVARRSLADAGVKVLVNSEVRLIDADGVIVHDRRIYARTVLWAAGVAASPAAKWLNSEADKAGRVKVQPDLSVAR